MAKYLLEEITLPQGCGDRVVECIDGSIRCHSVILVRNPDVFQRFNMLCKCMKSKVALLPCESSADVSSESGGPFVDAIPIENACHVCRFKVPFSMDVVLIIARFLYLDELSVGSPYSTKEDFLFRLVVASDYLSVHSVFTEALSLLQKVCSTEGFYTLLRLHDGDSLQSDLSRSHLLSTLEAVFEELAQAVIVSDAFCSMGYDRLSRFLERWLLKDRVKDLNRTEIMARWNVYYDKSVLELRNLSNILERIGYMDTNTSFRVACNNEPILLPAELRHVKLRFHELPVQVNVEVHLGEEPLFCISQTCHWGIYKFGNIFLSHSSEVVEIDLRFMSNSCTIFHGLDEISVCSNFCLKQLSFSHARHVEVVYL